MILTCPAFVEAVTSYKEDALDPWERVQYRAHLLHCRHCRAYVRQIEASVEAARASWAPAIDAPDAAPPALIERLRARRRG